MGSSVHAISDGSVAMILKGGPMPITRKCSRLTRRGALPATSRVACGRRLGAWRRRPPTQNITVDDRVSAIFLGQSANASGAKPSASGRQVMRAEERAQKIAGASARAPAIFRRGRVTGRDPHALTAEAALHSAVVEFESHAWRRSRDEQSKSDEKGLHGGSPFRGD